MSARPSQVLFSPPDPGRRRLAPVPPRCTHGQRLGETSPSFCEADTNTLTLHTCSTDHEEEADAGDSWPEATLPTAPGLHSQAGPSRLGSASGPTPHGAEHDLQLRNAPDPAKGSWGMDRVARQGRDSPERHPPSGPRGQYLRQVVPIPAPVPSLKWRKITG